MFYLWSVLERNLLDQINRRILVELQRDATVSLAVLSEKVGLSQTPCWNRIKRLEADGYIRSRVALLDRDKLNLGTTVFVAVKATSHDEKWLEDFARAVAVIPEIVELYRMSGDTDYLLKVVCRDIADYDRIYKKLIRATPMRDVSSSFAMEQIKYTTELPI